MVRIGLRDDYGQTIGAAVLTNAVPVGLDGACGGVGTCGAEALPGAEPTPDPVPGGRFPTFTLRSRSRRYTDEDGVVRFAWETWHSGEVVLRDLARREVSDAGGQAHVTAVIEVPAPTGRTPPRETATAWDEAGTGWTVTKIHDRGASWELSIERVDDGSAP